MEENLKLRFFIEELNSISNINIRKMCSWFVTKIPDYIFEVPASSSGKYHPKKAREKHGLVYHTKVAVNIAKHLFLTIKDPDIKYFEDIAIMALILHDSTKSGVQNTGHTLGNHPMIASSYIKSLFYQEYLNIISLENNLELRQDMCYVINEVTRVIESHMGRWNNNIMPTPNDVLSLIVHQADYLSSKLDKLDVEFPLNI